MRCQGSRSMLFGLCGRTFGQWFEAAPLGVSHLKGEIGGV